MPILETATPLAIGSGTYNLKYTMSSGTAKLQYSVDGEAFGDVPDTSKTSSTGITVLLPSCRVQSVLTGDAELRITKVS